MDLIWGNYHYDEQNNISINEISHSNFIFVIWPLGGSKNCSFDQKVIISHACCPLPPYLDRLQIDCRFAGFSLLLRLSSGGIKCGGNSLVVMALLAHAKLKCKGIPDSISRASCARLPLTKDFGKWGTLLHLLRPMSM